MRKGKKSRPKEMPETPSLAHLPKLPSLPRFPRIDFPERNSFSLAPAPQSFLPSLPSFPSSEFGEKMEKNAIKNSILPDLPEGDFEEDSSLEYPKDYNKAEENLEKAIEIEKEEEALGLPPPQIAKILPETEEKKAEELKGKQVFVKLENYKQGMQALSEMKNKIEEILGLISEIGDARAREETELAKWQEEAEALRLKLDKIEKNIFKV